MKYLNVSASYAAQCAKALVAGASVAIATAIPLVDNGLTGKEILIVVGAFLAGGFPTWAIPNAKANGDE